MGSDGLLPFLALVRLVGRLVPARVRGLVGAAFLVDRLLAAFQFLIGHESLAGFPAGLLAAHAAAFLAAAFLAAAFLAAAHTTFVVRAAALLAALLGFPFGHCWSSFGVG